MMPWLPVCPASSTTFWSVMYFFTRSSWPQFSRMVSIVPLAMPAQLGVSARLAYLTVHPSLVVARSPTT